MKIITDDGVCIDTDEYASKEYFVEEIDFNGYTFVGRCSQISCEDRRQYLYPKGENFYLIEMTILSKILFARRITSLDALRWLFFNNHHKNIPEALTKIPASAL